MTGMQHGGEEARYDLPDFEVSTRLAVKRLASIDLDFDRLDHELELRGYSRSDVVLVVLRERAEVLQGEYGQVVEQANRCQLQQVQFYRYVAGMKPRTVARLNDRINLILTKRLPAVPTLSLDVGNFKLRLTDTLLPPSRGYALTACDQNRRAVLVQIAAEPFCSLQPGETMRVPADTDLIVSGAGQTLRWKRVSSAIRSGKLVDALAVMGYLPSAAKEVPSILSRIFRRA